jgi:hypothetical protein
LSNHKCKMLSTFIFFSYLNMSSNFLLNLIQQLP